MRIAHYMPYMWSPGGVGQYIRRLSEQQHQAGHEIFFVDPQLSPTHPAQTTPDLGTSDLGIPIVLADPQQLGVVLERHHIEILHTHTVLPLMMGPLGKTIKVIRSIHNHDVYCPSGSRYLQQQATPCDRAYSRLGCLQGHLIERCGSLRPVKILEGLRRVEQEQRMLSRLTTLANSTFVKQQMVRSGYPAQQIHVVLLPAPTSCAEPPAPPESAAIRFLYLGRITPQKGWEWLLKAFAQAVSACPVPIGLDIAGTGNAVQEQSLHALIDRLNVGDHVTFHGWVDSSRAQQLLQRARALVFPSVWHEPAGLVTLEAAVAARAVIASHVGGIPEYIEALGNGLLVKPNDQQGLAEAILQLAADWQLAAQLGQTGREQVTQKFSLAGHEQTIRRLYQNVLDDQCE
jgi:glycosyltransferase involved in cell wall biosynthesis